MTGKVKNSYSGYKKNILFLGSIQNTSINSYLHAHFLLNPNIYGCCCVFLYHMWNIKYFHEKIHFLSLGRILKNF